jgi:hypothetical protein
MTSLSLTPIESYFFHDDVPGHPCWQILRVNWRGRLQRDALGKAWAAAAGRQPLWNAVVRRGMMGRLQWEQRESIVPAVIWSKREPGGEWPDWQPLDLERGSGVRLYAVEDGERTDTVLCVHHAVCDGLALVDVMEDVVIRYARELGENAEPRPDPTLSALRRRGRFGVAWWERLWLPLLQVAGMAAEARLLRRTVAPLVPHVPAASTGPRPENWPTIVCRRWSGAETAAIRSAAKSAKVSLQEMAMRDLQAAIGAWRIAQGFPQRQDWIRLGAAVNLRRRIRGTWPAANIFGIAIIDRRAGSLEDRGRLLRRAHEDMVLIDDLKFGYGFWMLLRLRRWWPGGIRAYARRPVVRMTIVMAFMGKVFMRIPVGREGAHPAVPGAVAEDLQGVAPTRPGTCACIDVGIAMGNLAATLNYDSRVLTRDQAAALVEEFSRQLAMSASGT